MSTPARKSGRQSKPTEKFKEYLYGSDECEVPPKKDSISPIIGHTRTSKEKPIKPDTTNHSIITKRGRPRKTIVDEDSFKNKNKKSESEDENIEDYTKGNKFKKEDVPPKKTNKTPTTRNTQTLKERTLKPDAASHTINRKRGRPCKSNLDADLLKNKDKELESEESESEDEDNDDKVNKFKKGYEPPRKDNKTSTAGHTQIAKVKPLITDATSHTIKQKRGRPLKSVVDADSLNNKNDKLERSEDEDDDNDIKGKKVTKENQESGPRRSGRPPKLNERLLNYLHLDEGLLGENGHLSMKRKENSSILSPKKFKKNVMSEESERTKDDKVIEGPAVRTVRNTSIGTKKALGRMKSVSPQKLISKEKEESITEIKKTMISRLLSMGNDISKKMLEDNTKTLLELSSHSSDNINDPLSVLNLENPTEDLDDETTERILKWLDEEEKERQQYRQKLLESMKKSHEKTMEMYKQILKALE